MCSQHYERIYHYELFANLFQHVANALQKKVATLSQHAPYVSHICIGQVMTEQLADRQTDQQM